MRTTASGFTMIELMIVTAIIGIVASIAVPNLISSRAVANERVVIASLRTIATAQLQCQSRAVVDVDGDGFGEALGLAELAGLRPLRSGVPPLTPATLPASLGTLDPTGLVRGRGYLLALHLPDATGSGLLSVPANDPSIEPDNAEVAWTCLAWPLNRGNTGRSTFFVNQMGEVLCAKNAPYDGGATMPPAGAALLGVTPTTIVGGRLAADTVGADGNLWTVVR